MLSVPPSSDHYGTKKERHIVITYTLKERNNISVETSRNESYVRISTAAENGLIVIQTKNITLPLFSTNAIFGVLVVSW